MTAKEARQAIDSIPNGYACRRIVNGHVVVRWASTVVEVVGWRGTQDFDDAARYVATNPITVNAG